ncbi:MAG: phosphatase PAP2 family protein [Labedaea sp.]
MTARWVVIAGALAATVLALTWLALADAVVDRLGAPTPLDAAVLSFMLDHRNAVLTAILIVVTYAGGTVAMAVLTAVATGWLARRRDWSDAVLVAVAGSGALILIPVTKGLIGRERPPVASQLLIQMTPAFPSGHALGSLTVVGALTAVALTRLPTRSVRVLFTCAGTLFVLTVGISRLYLGVHWATDVLGGWLLGATWLVLCLTTSTLITLGRGATGPAPPP